jgi:gamma-glutamyltranspeptidase / glutathione hydrolase
MSVLEGGGNAFDAAVAAGFVLQVAEPHLNGPGGQVPILLWDEAAQQVSVVCGQGVGLEYPIHAPTYRPWQACRS